MKAHTIDGKEVELPETEVKRIQSAHSAHTGLEYSRTHDEEIKTHHFDLGGKKLTLTVPEMKQISDAYWEHYGKKKMVHFFAEYRTKAADNIRKALGFCNPPTSEKEVKNAIAIALTDGDVDLISEVIFEAMEWQSAYAGIESSK